MKRKEKKRKEKKRKEKKRKEKKRKKIIIIIKKSKEMCSQIFIAPLARSESPRGRGWLVRAAGTPENPGGLTSF